LFNTRCSGSKPPFAMASSSLRFFSATRVAVGQKRLRSAIHAATSSGVSSRTFVPRMGMGFLCAAEQAKETVSERVSDFSTAYG
jgi:hypothetical protein